VFSFVFSSIQDNTRLSVRERSGVKCRRSFIGHIS